MKSTKLENNCRGVFPCTPANRQHGITLIALIITIIVMLILVGVTINVALNGGLFIKAKDAADKTSKEVEKESIMEIVLGEYNAVEGKITNAGSLETKITNQLGFQKNEEKTSTSKLVVEGAKGRLWQIDLNTAKVEEYQESNGKIYEFTIGELGSKGLLDGLYDMSIPLSEFCGEEIAEKLKNNYVFEETDSTDGTITKYYNIKSEDPKYINILVEERYDSDYPYQIVFAIIEASDGDKAGFMLMNEGDEITNSNYANYADLLCTIYEPE